jgi:hypothetical protein
MDIAALSMNISAVSASVQAQRSILKMAMDIPAQAVGNLLDSMLALEEEMAKLMTGLGQNIDVYA